MSVYTCKKCGTHENIRFGVELIPESDETLKRKLAAYEAIVDDMDLECRSFDERSEAELAARDEQAFWVRRFREVI